MLGRFLQVRRGESASTLLLFLYMFLVMSSYIVTKNTRDALFLERFSAARGLPYADMVSALTIVAVMSLYLRVSRRAGLRSLLIGTLLISAAATGGFWFVARVREPIWMVPVLYVWASVSGTLLPAQVWTLAGQVMTTRGAKRLFGVVGSGMISGGIVGGLVTTIAPRVGAANLLLLSAATLAICPVLVLAIWRERQIDRSATAASPAGGEEPLGMKASVLLVWRSPHLRAVAALICLSSMVTTVVAWQFRATAKAYIPGTDALAAFFGTFNVYAGSLSLAVQLLLTSRLLQYSGLGAALLVLPVAYTAGALGLLVSGSLWAAIVLRGSDQVLRYSIDRSSAELLYLPVPARQRERAKALIDTVGGRVGDGVASLLVLIGVTLVGLTTSQVSLLTLLLLVGWFAAALSARRHYVESLRSSIYEHRLDAERLSEHMIERSTTDMLVDALRAGNDEDILYGLTLLDRGDLSSHRAVSRLLDHRSPAVRQKAIALLATWEDTTALPRVERLLRDEDGTVRAEALLFMARYGDVDPLLLLGDLDEMPESAMASAIAHFLARAGPAQNIEAVRVLLDAATSGDGADSYRARLEAARLIGSLPDQFEEQLNALLKDRAPDVAQLAIRAAPSVGKQASVPLVVARLADASLAADAADALVAFGNRAVPALRAAIADEATAPAVRHAIPDVLQRVATPEAEVVLVDYLLDADPVLRLRTVSALNKLRQLAGSRELEAETVETVLVAEILGHYRSYQLLDRLSGDAAATEPTLARVKASMDEELERIFRLMNLLLPDHDLHSAYVGLQSGNAVVHANALEFLENTLPARLRTLILPLIDSEVSLQARIKIADRMVGATLETSEQALAALVYGHDDAL